MPGKPQMGTDQKGLLKHQESPAGETRFSEKSVLTYPMSEKTLSPRRTRRARSFEKVDLETFFRALRGFRGENWVSGLPHWVYQCQSVACLSS